MDWACAAAIAVCIFMPSLQVKGGQIDVMIARQDGTMLTALHVDCEKGFSVVQGVSSKFEAGSFADKLCTSFVGRAS